MSDQAKIWINRNLFSRDEKWCKKVTQITFEREKDERITFFFPSALSHKLWFLSNVDGGDDALPQNGRYGDHNQTNPNSKPETARLPESEKVAGILFKFNQNFCAHNNTATMFLLFPIKSLTLMSSGGWILTPPKLAKTIPPCAQQCQEKMVQILYIKCKSVIKMEQVVVSRASQFLRLPRGCGGDGCWCCCCRFQAPD